jgi:hypothetical protein
VRWAFRESRGPLALPVRLDQPARSVRKAQSVTQVRPVPLAWRELLELSVLQGRSAQQDQRELRVQREQPVPPGPSARLVPRARQVRSVRKAWLDRKALPALLDRQEPLVLRV